MRHAAAAILAMLLAACGGEIADHARADDAPKAITPPPSPVGCYPWGAGVACCIDRHLDGIEPECPATAALAAPAGAACSELAPVPGTCEPLAGGVACCTSCGCP